MKLTQDISRLLFTMIGALGGAALGLYAMFRTFKYYEQWVSAGGPLPVLAAAVFIGGGLAGGGYLLLWLHTKWEKIAPKRRSRGRKKYEPDKDKKRKK